VNTGYQLALWEVLRNLISPIPLRKGRTQHDLTTRTWFPFLACWVERVLLKDSNPFVGCKGRSWGVTIWGVQRINVHSLDQIQVFQDLLVSSHQYKGKTDHDKKKLP
jgi:hypothetical protein